MKIEIEKNIPLENPVSQNLKNKLDIYPLQEMELWDSFLVKVKEGQTVKNLQIEMSNAGRRYVLKFNQNKKFTTRIIDSESVRMWRIL